MFQIIFRAQVEPVNREEFIDFISEDIRVAEKSEPGTLRFDLYQDKADQNAFFVHEAYQDEKAFKDHQRVDPYKRWKSEICPKITRFDQSREGNPLRSLASKEQITDVERSFRTKDYEIKVTYLNGQFTRMWQRFQFFVTIQTALVGGKAVFGDKSSMPLAIAGAVISIAWFIIGAEDRYLVTAYRLQADAAGKASARCMLGGADVESYEPVGQLKLRSPELKSELKSRNWLERLTEWRCEGISITRLPAWLALLALVGWLSVLIAHFTFK